MSAPVEAPPKPVSWATRIAKAPWRLIGIVLLVVVLLNIDLKTVFAKFVQIGPLPIVLASGAFVILLVGRYWRWRVLTLAVGVRQPLWESVASCNRSIWLGMATPGRVGEFRRAADLSVARGWGLAASSGLVLVELLIDLGAYATVGFGGFLWLSISDPLGVILGVTVLLVAAVTLLSLGRIAGLAGQWAPVLLRIPGFSELLPALHAGLRGRLAAQMLPASLVAVTGYVVMIWLLVHPMQADLCIDEVGTAVGLAGVAGAVPITYFGLGTRDVMLLSFFDHIGRPAEQAIVLSFCVLLAQLIGIFVSLAAGPLIGLSSALSRKPGQSA
jgi:uncharacterized membrane protein YbhN (UPF0104 family)